MGTSDIGCGLELCRAAGWNQLQADWERLLTMGVGFVAVVDDQVAGTVLMLDPRGPVAWIAMMLVDPAVRGRSIGRMLLEHALARTTASSVGLDATELGRPLYEKFGFQPHCRIIRWQRGPALMDGHVQGSSAPFRVGYSSLHIGPLIANSPSEAAGQVVAAIATNPNRTWILDSPSRTPWEDRLVQLGFLEARSFTRMNRGPALAIEPNLYATSGPEFGPFDWRCGPQ